MRIELEDEPQAAMVSLAQAVLRCALGGIMVVHGLEKLHAQSDYATLLERAGAFEVELVASVVLWAELVAGACLILGRYTRFAAFVAVCDLALGIALDFVLGELWHAPIKLEAASLTLAVSCFFLVVGSGPYGLDNVLRRRARLRAIARDEIWSRPPYVTHR